MSTLEKYLNMSEKERAEVIDSGMFNSFIEAYLIVTLHSMGMPAEDIKEAKKKLKEVLEDTAAEEVKEMAKGI